MENAVAHARQELLVPEPSHRSRARDRAEVIIATGVVLTLCYVAKLVLVTILASILLAFILAPLRGLLQRLYLPRSLSSLIAVLLLVSAVYGATWFSYSQTVIFVASLPKYSNRISESVMNFRKQAETFQRTTETLLPSDEDTTGSQAQPAPRWGLNLRPRFGSLSQVLLAVSFVPFLVYFMLSWQHHVRASTVMLFRMENRHAAYVTLGMIASMIRSFMVGNLLVGLFLAVVSTLVFAAIGLPFSYIVGGLSGFLSLVPYAGAVLAIGPPIMVGLGQITSGDFVVIAVCVFGLHVFALNVLYPKLLGDRLQLNPLAVTLGLLFWGWMWGGMGLILAIPITGGMKVIFDHVDSLRAFGAWLGK
jgi:predicted PurR-regulated permease PerM